MPSRVETTPDGLHRRRANRNEAIPLRGPFVCHASAVYQESTTAYDPGGQFKGYSSKTPGLARPDSRISTWWRSSGKTTRSEPRA